MKNVTQNVPKIIHLRKYLTEFYRILRNFSILLEFLKCLIDNRITKLLRQKLRKNDKIPPKFSKTKLPIHPIIPSSAVDKTVSKGCLSKFFISLLFKVYFRIKKFEFY